MLSANFKVLSANTTPHTPSLLKPLCDSPGSPGRLLAEGGEHKVYC